MLEDAIHEINNHNASGLSFEELYRSASLFVGDVGRFVVVQPLQKMLMPAWHGHSVKLPSAGHFAVEACGQLAGAR